MRRRFARASLNSRRRCRERGDSRRTTITLATLSALLGNSLQFYVSPHPERDGSALCATPISGIHPWGALTDCRSLRDRRPLNVSVMRKFSHNQIRESYGRDNDGEYQCWGAATPVANCPAPLPVGSRTRCGDLNASSELHRDGPRSAQPGDDPAACRGARGSVARTQCSLTRGWLCPFLSPHRTRCA